MAIHLVVKPDFQRSINNVFYKSVVSNVISTNNISIRVKHLNDFSSPVGVCLPPMEWVVNYDTRLPERIIV